MSECIFCNIEKQIDSVIYSTKNFFVKIGIGLTTAGHVLLIPYKHYGSMGHLPDELVEEYLQLKNVVVDKVEKEFAEPFLIEYGNFGQSVPHAHTHIIPKTGNGFKDVDFFAECVLPYCDKKKSKLINVKTFKELQEYTKKYDKYFYYEDESGRFIIEIVDGCKHTETPDYRNYFTKIKNIPACKGWKNMTDEEKEIDKAKIELTKKKLIFT